MRRAEFTCLLAVLAATPPGGPARAATASLAEAEAAARALAADAPSTELRNAAARFLTQLETRRLIGDGIRGNSDRGDSQERQLEASEELNRRRIVEAAERLPSAYHDASFRCLEDALTCRRDGIPALVCSGTVLVCLASKVLRAG